jgi:hypothetical protein
LRFLVEDAHNGKRIGLFGLCDPVFSVAAAMLGSAGTGIPEKPGCGT